MTREEEAIKILKDGRMTREEASFILANIDRRVCDDELNEALDMAIEALEQEPCEDCISRSKVLEGKVIHQSCDGVEIINSYAVPVEYIEQLLPVTPKEKTGRWISFGIQGEIDGQIVRAFTCSKCGAISIFRVSNGNIVNGDLCPNCGAKMVEPQESEDKEVENG